MRGVAGGEAPMGTRPGCWPDLSRTMSDAITNITEAHKAAFDALRDAAIGNPALFSCFVNGSPRSWRSRGLKRRTLAIRSRRSS